MLTADGPNIWARSPRPFLPEMPIDPFTGPPLRYRRFEDGIAVFSIGEGDANAVRRRMAENDPLVGLGVGWRLWNPELRRQPPLPRTVPDNP